MSVSFAGTVIVSDSQGATMFGGATYEGSAPEREDYKRSMPRAAGVFKVTAGTREAYHTLTVEYHSAGESTVRATLNAFSNAGTIGTLQIETSAGSTESFKYCQMLPPTYQKRRAGYLGGNKVMVTPVIIVFEQLRPTAA